MSCTPSSFRLDAMRSDITMWNLALLSGILMLVYGVSAADEDKSVSVLVGDSVTLIINNPETEKADELRWKIENKFIAKFDRETNKPPIYPDERFRDRLKLDHQTGSLTIMNIKITDSGLYQLQIKTPGINIIKRFNIAVHDEVKSLSVVEGDTVTINTGVTGILSACLNGTIDSSAENIDLNHEAGEITIRNIRRDQSGVYKVEINTNNMILHIKYNIAVGEMKTISVKEGDPVNLLTGLFEIQGHDLILWKFKDTLIAEINKGSNRFLTHDSSDERFKGRLQLDRQSGSLTISDSRSTDSGVYHLQMNSSSHTVQRNIDVTVSGVFGGEVKTVIEGESVTLNPDLTEINTYRRILWRFGSDLIAQISEGKISYKPGPDGRFRDRLQLDSETGSLTITNMTVKHSGLYKLETISTSETTYKTFNVSVNVPDLPDQKTPDEQTPDSGLSPGAVAGIVVVVLLVFAAAAAGWIFYRKKNSEPKGSKASVIRFLTDDAEPKESNKPLNSETANGGGLSV